MTFPLCIFILTLAFIKYKTINTSVLLSDYFKDKRIDGYEFMEILQKYSINPSNVFATADQSITNRVITLLRYLRSSSKI